ncbi:MAG: ammonia-forming cytochrome c nitrite reductase subunit c552 [Deltaproteobacteria bacterium]|nr:ammonia-forming cytochrome c nitrite reductase subunit c552 [Deltaproteobacteria bacterium]
MEHLVARNLGAVITTLLVFAAIGCGGDDAAATPATDSGAPDTTADAPEDAVVPETSVDAVADVTVDTPATQNCATCHSAYIAKIEGSKHKALTNKCLDCHKDALAHQADPSKVKASLDFSLDLCATCHADQKTQYLFDDATKPGDYGGSIKTSKYLDFPKYKHLMGGHGFTVEYNEERAHAYMLKDHIEIARKQNAVCLQCKSTPLTYFWGETRRGETVFGKELAWDASVAKIKANWPSTIDHGTACNHCHDPHTTSFRLIRKQMINAILERGTDPYDATRNYVPKSVADLNAKLNEKGTDGKLTDNAKRLVGTLTCAQCHVEYTCGPGADKTVLRDEWPWRKLRDLEAYYKVKYDTVQDWTHSGTGLKGIKAQHPETEFFWESKHYKAGATCMSCHMGTTEAGKPRSHWFTSPFKNPEKTCAGCHTGSLSSFVTMAKTTQKTVMTKATTVENDLDAVLTKIEALATDETFDKAKLLQAKEAFMKGLLWWEFTVVSENSAGFHNPDEATINLDTAQGEANKAKALLGL